MVKKPAILVPLAVFAWLVLAWSASSAQEKDKADKRDLQAREAAEQFMKGMWKQDIEAVMNTVDIPFFLNARTNLGKIIGNIKDREELKKYLEASLTPIPPEVEYKVRAISSFGSLPQNFFSDQDNKVLKEILKKSDRIVLFQVPRRFIALAVSGGENKPKVVGLVTVGLLSLAVITEEKEKRHKSAVQAMKAGKEAVQHFLKAARAKDLDSLVKLTDVPWYSNGSNIIEDRDKLKQLLKSTWVDRNEIPSQVLGIIRIGEIGRPFFRNDRLPPEEFIAKDVWVVIVGWENGQQNGKQGWGVFVRVSEGKARIVGVPE